MTNTTRNYKTNGTMKRERYQQLHGGEVVTYDITRHLITQH